MDDVCIYSKYYTHTHRECDEVAMKIVCVVVVFLPFSKTSKKQRKGKKESSFCGKGVRFEEEPKREERRPQRRKRKTF